jgi:SAM-dependent methyltransferase
MQPCETLLRALAAWTGPSGNALDVACGAGRHSLFLANHNWTVTAVDASETALDLLRTHQQPNIRSVLANLEAFEFLIQSETYHLICDFYYLQRDLFPAIAAGIKPGGFFVGEIPMVDHRPGVPPMNPAFLLQPGELRSFFEGWELLESAERIPADTERGGHRRRVATLIARKPGR